MKDDSPTSPSKIERATLKRVADELGVSPMTVSNAYNRPDQLSSTLRARVFETARRLGYAGPDPTARGLRRGNVGALGVLYDTTLSYAVGDAAAAAFLQGLAGAAEAAKLSLSLIPGFAGEQRDAAAVRGAVVDGFIVYSVAAGDPPTLAALERQLPLVVVDQPLLTGVPMVGIDDRAAAARAAEHLLSLGHRRFGVVSFGLRRDGWSGLADLVRQGAADYHVSRARLEGYRSALEGAGIAWQGVPVFECPGSARPLGREAARSLLEPNERPTALLALSDPLALGALDAARELGLAVPQDLSVVGFDDTLEAASSAPALATVHQDHAAKGRLAGGLLTALLRGEQVEHPGVLSAELVVRASTAPPQDA